RLSDWSWLRNLSLKSQSSYQFFAQLDQDLWKDAEAWINEELHKQSLSSISLGGQIIPTANVSAKAKKELGTYASALSSFGLSPQLRQDQILLKPTVQVEVVLAELSERLDQAFGMSWGKLGEFQVLPTASFKTALTAQLQALEIQGKAKVLATPRLLCRSGAEAEFHSGGEFPVPITEYQSHYKSQNIQWKKHGLILKFEPLSDSQGHISLKVFAELSLLTDSQVGDTPALLTNKVMSSFDLEQAQTVALSGLVREDWIQGGKGLPYLQRIPVLGTLFGLQSKTHRRSELVIFVTAKILEENNSAVEMPRGWNDSSL
ncbi:MAG: type II and III secretion system protein, partial [Bdellovibrionales bacterium]|nr:type II and III secretion system protein [Bdellovibrionales bacterium]